MEPDFGHPLERCPVNDRSCRTPLSSRNREFGFSKSTQFGRPANSDLSPTGQRIWSNLRDTFRSRKADVNRYDENSSPRTNLGRRKSLRDIFATVRKRKSHKEFLDSGASVVVEQNDTFSPPKRILSFGERQFPEVAPAAKRRKSLSDIIGTITSRVSPARNWKKSFRARRDFPNFDILADTESYDDGLWRLSEKIQASNLSNVDNLDVVLPPTTHRSLILTNNTPPREYLSRSASPVSGLTVPILSELCDGSLRDSFGVQSILDKIAASKYEERESDNIAANPKSDPNSQYHILVGESRIGQTGTECAFHTSGAYDGTPSIHPQKLEAVDPEESRLALSFGRQSNEFIRTFYTKGTCPEVQKENRDTESLREVPTSHHVMRLPEDQLKTLAPLTVAKSETTSSIRSQDIDPTFSDRLEARKEKYRKLEMEFSDLEVAKHEKIATCIRLTVARMTKNIHAVSFTEENTSVSFNQSYQVPQAALASNQHQKRFLETVALGKKILSQTQETPCARRSYPSQQSLKYGELTNQSTQKSSSPAKPCKYIAPTGNNSCRSHKTSIDSLESTTDKSWLRAEDSSHDTPPSSSTLASRARTVSVSDFHNALAPAGLTSGIQKLSGLKGHSHFKPTSLDVNPTRERIQLALGTQPSPEEKQHIVFDPVHVKYPQTPKSSFRMEVFENKAEAMTMLCEQNLVDFDRFCTYDPKAQIFNLYTPNAVLPSLPILQKKGLEVFWLPVHRKNLLTQGSEPCKLPAPSTHDIQPFDPVIARPTRSKAHDMIFTANGESLAYSTEWSLVSHYPTKHQESFHNPAELGYSGFAPQYQEDPAKEVAAANSDSDKENSIFDEDYLLEVDPELARSYLGSQFDETDSVIYSDSESVRASFILEFDGQSIQLDETVCGPPKNPTQLGGEYLDSLRSKRAMDNWNALADEPGLSESRGDNLSLGVDTDANTLVARTRKEPVRGCLLPSRPTGLQREAAGLQDSTNTSDLENGGPTIESCNDVTHSPQMTWTELGDAYLESRRVMSSEDEDSPKSETTIDNTKIRPRLKAPDQTLLSEQIREIGKCKRFTEMQLPATDRIFQLVGNGMGIKYCKSDDSGSLMINQDLDDPIESLPSGFKFTSYAEHLLGTSDEHQETPEAKGHAVNTITVAHIVDQIEAQTLPTSIEPCQMSSDDYGRLKHVTAHDLNIRFVGKAARQKGTNDEPGKVGALIDVFQSQGLMPPDARSVLSRPLPPVLSTSYKRNSSSRTPSPLHAKSPEDMENRGSNIEAVPDVASPDDIY